VLLPSHKLPPGHTAATNGLLLMPYFSLPRTWVLCQADRHPKEWGEATGKRSSFLKVFYMKVILES